jgi:hypothetical protein
MKEITPASLNCQKEKYADTIIPSHHIPAGTELYYGIVSGSPVGVGKPKHPKINP